MFLTMSHQFSIVIVCKNEERNIGRVLQSLAGLTDDVLVYDNGSTDGTLTVLRQYGVRIHEGAWMGYGKTKREAVRLAKYDWVLSIDADEALDEELQQALQTISLTDATTVYQIAFKNLLGEKVLRWGEWGGDKHIRLFNRTNVNWDEAPVHESLTIPPSAVVKKLPGFILHRTVKDTVEYSNKMVKYALLNAQKYYAQGKKSSWLKRYVSPRFTFVKHYIFGLGFLDGWEGLLSARMTAFYTFLKYARLYELWRKS
ncbi:glycosyltransferase family 2 protein [Flavisolibacter ginsenosidimutans]|uniref:Glycosyltransferase family 2 protein n=2 Tax=Flavisolibacter ginsenosidimutans TaxID=661481 RepID=A0A5B8UKX6_9BACT|nr:glycosyltransferase family 2 protein [Flavisolibacter ginsenosidimutans]